MCLCSTGRSLCIVKSYIAAITAARQRGLALRQRDMVGMAAYLLIAVLTVAVLIVQLRT
jgi:hypothetical protein